MTASAADKPIIAGLPRGGFDASCLDRLLQTDHRAHLDRDALDRAGRLFGRHRHIAGLVLDAVADIPDPQILELGAGSGAVSQLLLENHPSAKVTVTDIDPAAVAELAAGELGADPRATVRRMDAAAIDAPDAGYHLALFALGLHQLPPQEAVRVFAEGTRVADTLMIVDLPRPPAPLHLLGLAAVLPLAPFVPLLRDGMVASLGCYAPSAYRSLAAHADPAIEVQVRGGVFGPQVVLARR